MTNTKMTDAEKQAAYRDRQAAKEGRTVKRKPAKCGTLGAVRKHQRGTHHSGKTLRECRTCWPFWKRYRDAATARRKAAKAKGAK